MKVLVTGGAGYIGSFMTKRLLEKDYQVVVLDNLERGHKENIPSEAEFINADITNTSQVESVFGGTRSIDAVMHFAGLIAVGESEQEPELYYQNNVVGSKVLFDTAINHGVKKIIFSSSAAVYGNPRQIPIPEEHDKNPTSVYGKNKLEVEQLLTQINNQNPQIAFAALRYFNAAGAAIDGSLGEAHLPETHIIPLSIQAAINNTEFNLMGTDYATKDGTCIRDYIHVLDLVEAHVLALEKLETDSGAHFYNVGTGNGFSNKEVLESVERISGLKVNIINKSRRAGDSDKLIADPAKITAELGFSPQYSNLEVIIKSAWEWHKNQFKI